MKFIFDIESLIDFLNNIFEVVLLVKTLEYHTLRVYQFNRPISPHNLK